jgi:LuxR family maltose regulon positive regulatory protein
MPKIPTYTLAWSPAVAAYELYETASREVLQIVPESSEWFAWVDQVSSFAFAGQSGHYTARKEAKQRGHRYWYVYLALGERLTKKYLGKSADLTLARLEQTAGILRAQSETRLFSPQTRAEASANKEAATRRLPVPAQQPLQV